MTWLIDHALGYLVWNDDHRIRYEHNRAADIYELVYVDQEKKLFWRHYLNHAPTASDVQRLMEQVREELLEMEREGETW